MGHWRVVAWTLAVATAGLAQQPQSGLQILAPLTGSWAVTTEVKPEPHTEAGTLAGDWILGDRFFRLVERGGDGRERTVQIIAYDQPSGRYRYWRFSADGTPVLELGDGRWSEAEKRLAFTRKQGEGAVVVTLHLPGGDEASIDSVVVSDAEPIFSAHGSLSREQAAQNPEPEQGDPRLLKREEWQLLAKRLGKWRATAHIRPSAWIPNEGRVVSTETVNWALGGRYLAGAGHTADGTRDTAFWLMTFDDERKQFLSHHFNADGTAVTITGRWMPALRMMLIAGDPESPVQLSGMWQFVTDDRLSWAFSVVTAEGTVGLDMAGMTERQ